MPFPALATAHASFPSLATAHASFPPLSLDVPIGLVVEMQGEGV